MSRIAAPPHLLPEPGWVSYYITKDDEANAGIVRFRGNYERPSKSAQHAEEET